MSGYDGRAFQSSAHLLSGGRVMSETDQNLRTAGGISGRIGITLFFTIFAGMGLFFIAVAGRTMLGTVGTYFWKEAPAEILDARVVEEPGSESPYVVLVRFRYSWDGAVYESDTFEPATERYSDFSRAQDRIEGLTPGARTNCFVNPEEPNRAVLRQGGLWILLFLLIPGVFVMVGIGGIYGTWVRKAGPANRSQPVTGPQKGQWAGRLFALVFVLVGAVILVVWYLPSLWGGLASYRWIEAPCEVVSSRVVEVDSDDGATYRVDILYKYTFDGREYRSNRYKSFGGSSSGRARKQDIVDGYPPGTRTVCFIDPASPGRAVLVRGVGWEAAVGLMPIAFIGVGLFVFFIMRAGPRSAVAAPESGTDAGEARELKSRSTPWGRLLGTLFACLFWNGIVSLFLFQAIDEWQRGQSPWVLTIFLVPFVLVGLVLVGGVGYACLVLANPRAKVTTSPGIWVAGGEIEVAWSLSGATGRLSRLQVFIEGREEATYRRGTSTTTDRHVFARFAVADPASLLEMAQGQTRVRLPARIPPTFASENNRIVWLLKVRGTIPVWPDLDEEFDVVVGSGGKK